jgi:hypothetical protein
MIRIQLLHRNQQGKVVVLDEPVDLDREIQEEIESTDPDRWRYQTALSCSPRSIRSHTIDTGP